MKSSNLFCCLTKSEYDIGCTTSMGHALIIGTGFCSYSFCFVMVLVSCNTYIDNHANEYLIHHFFIYFQYMMTILHACSRNPRDHLYDQCRCNTCHEICTWVSCYVFVGWLYLSDLIGLLNLPRTLQGYFTGIGATIILNNSKSLPCGCNFI